MRSFLLAVTLTRNARNYSPFHRISSIFSHRYQSSKQISFVKMVNKYQIIERGVPNSLDYRIFFSKYEKQMLTLE